MFNALYWHFTARNEDTLCSNNRLKMVYRNLNNMYGEVRDALMDRAEQVINQLKPFHAEDYI